MNTNDRKETWMHFSYNMYCSNPIYKYLKEAEILETEDGCSIRIPVDSYFTEFRINRELPEIRRKMGYQSYNHLLPVRFSFLREDGTIITEEEWKKTQEKHLNSMSKDPLPEFWVRSRQEVFQDSLKEDIRQSNSAITEFVNDNSSTLDAGRCKDEFKQILSEIHKAIEEEPSFDCVDHLLTVTKDPLCLLEKELGSDSNLFMHISNLIVHNCLNIIIKIVNGKQTRKTIKEAQDRVQQLYSYTISDITKQRVSETSVKIADLDYAIQRRIEAEKASLLSERIKNFALKHSTLDGGDRRITSPGWAVLVLIVLSFASWVAIFEKIGSLFKKKSDV